MILLPCISPLYLFARALSLSLTLTST
jgi:hypothetical protein